MTIRPLRAEEIAPAASMLSLTFMDDPLFRFMMPGEGSRRAWLRWFHHRALLECHRAGGAITVDGPDRGVAGFYPPGTWPTTLRSMLGSVPMLPFPYLLPPPRLATVGLRVEHRMTRVHPAEPHLYLYVLGVHPTQKGKGLGGALLRHLVAVASEADVTSHLETANPVNVPLYRKFGYEITKTIAVGDAPPLWTMTTSRADRAA